MSQDKKEFDAQAETDRVRFEAIASPEPGQDPDSRQRLAKTLAAANVKLPAGLSVDPVTAEDREQFVEAAGRRAEALAAKVKAHTDKGDGAGDHGDGTGDKGHAQAGDDRAHADAKAKEEARKTAPQGRSTKPTHAG